MLWVVGSICMTFLGVGAVAIGLLLPGEWGYAVLGGILVVVGILLLVAFRRAAGPLSRL
jgi:hypothetical protein